MSTTPKFNYMMLSRLQQDCEYFLNYGLGNAKQLYYGEVERHIAEMKKLWNGFPNYTGDRESGKPEWLSYADIKVYEERMLRCNKMKNIDITKFKELNINTTEDVKVFFEMLKELDLVFHPDDPFNEYMFGETNTPVFSEEDSVVLENILDNCHVICDTINEGYIYDLGMEIFHRQPTIESINNFFNRKEDKETNVFVPVKQCKAFTLDENEYDVSLESHAIVTDVDYDKLTVSFLSVQLNPLVTVSCTMDVHLFMETFNPKVK